MRSLSILAFLAGLALVLGAALARGSLALFTDQAPVTGNTFTTAACFPVHTCESFASIADSYVKKDNATTNFGTATTMQVDGNATKTKRSLFQFDISSIPAGSTINSATLTLCLTPGNNSPGHIHELRTVTSSWTETVVTWNDQPSASATVTDSITVPSAAQCMTFAATADVQAWVDGTTNDGWRLNDQNEDSGGSKVDYNTREHGTASERPNLDVTYTPP